MRSTSYFQLAPFAFSAALLFAGCQGVDWGSDDDDDATTAPPAGDDDDASVPPGDEDTVTVDLTGGPVYFTFSDRAVVSPATAETSTAWDLKVDGAAFNLNGGQSGPGAAWGFGPVLVGESEYETFTDHADVIIQFEFVDEFESVLTDWYFYTSQGHKIYSRYHVYAIEVGDTVYKLQPLSYYGELNGSPESAMIDVRWSEIDSDAPIYTTIDARAGGSRAGEDDPENKYTYFSLDQGKVVDLTDEEALESLEWDFAFKRYDVKLNGGMSGPKGVRGFDFQSGREETEAEVKAFTDASQLADFEAADSAGIDGPWTEDRIGCILNTSFDAGGDGDLVPTGNVYVVTGADGSSYYKFMVTDLKLDGNGNPTELTYRVAPIQ